MLRIIVAIIAAGMTVWCAFGSAGAAQVNVAMMSLPFFLLTLLAISEAK